MAGAWAIAIALLLAVERRLLALAVSGGGAERDELARVNDRRRRRHGRERYERE